MSSNILDKRTPNLKGQLNFQLATAGANSDGHDPDEFERQKKGQHGENKQEGRVKGGQKDRQYFRVTERCPLETC